MLLFCVEVCTAESILDGVHAPVRVCKRERERDVEVDLEI